MCVQALIRRVDKAVCHEMLSQAVTGCVDRLLAIAASVYTGNYLSTVDSKVQLIPRPEAVLVEVTQITAYTMTPCVCSTSK